MKIKILMAFVIAALLGGCATRSEIVKMGARDRFVSSLKPLNLAMCIDRNVDENSALGSLRSKVIDPGTEPVEVVVMNGPTTHSVVQISTFEGGSVALFYYGGVASIAPPGYVYQMMSKGCQGIAPKQM